MTEHHFMWLDLETTGLDPTAGRVLEFAVALVDDGPRGDMSIVREYAGVIAATDVELDALTIDPYVHRMHTKRGLWRDVAASTTTIQEVDLFLAGLADELCDGPTLRLAGSSVHFDLAWVRVHMPAFAARCSHRVLDVTSLRAAVDAWCPWAPVWPRRLAHRALEDVRATIEEARLVRDAMTRRVP